MAKAVGAEVVVVHPPFRWQKEYARDFVNGIAALEESTGIAFAVENMYPWRASSKRGMEMYLPGWDPSDEPYANTTVDLSHASDRRRRPDRDGRPARLAAAAHPPHRRQRLGQGRAPGAGPRAPSAPRSSCTTSPATGFRGEIVLEINTRKAADRAEREKDLRESLEFAREHFFAPTG